MKTNSHKRASSRKRLTPDTVRSFQEAIYNYYRGHARRFPWRTTRDPYRILVSEIMLQQTQTERVLRKYEGFIDAFPDFPSLAEAPLREILKLWQGLGYNRRAIALKEIARLTVRNFRGELPSSACVLTTFPGIGPATASAICAFAFNQPAVLIETNIRRVFIHFFFKDERNIADARIRPLVEETLDASNPRQWYYALMDYGAMLGKERPNSNKRSAHYRKQSPFNGSNRQIRGMILRVLVAKPTIPENEMMRRLDTSPKRVRNILIQLQKEGFIERKRGNLTLL